MIEDRERDNNDSRKVFYDRLYVYKKKKLAMKILKRFQTQGTINKGMK